MSTRLLMGKVPPEAYKALLELNKYLLSLFSSKPTNSINFYFAQISFRKYFLILFLPILN